MHTYIRRSKFSYPVINLCIRILPPQKRVNCDWTDLQYVIRILNFLCLYMRNIRLLGAREYLTTDHWPPIIDRSDFWFDVLTFDRHIGTSQETQETVTGIFPFHAWFTVTSGTVTSFENAWHWCTAVTIWTMTPQDQKFHRTALLTRLREWLWIRKKRQTRRHQHA